MILVDAGPLVALIHADDREHDHCKAVFYSLNDQVPKGSIGRFFEAAIDWKNSQFLEDLSRDVKRGLYDLVQNKRAMPGTPNHFFLATELARQKLAPIAPPNFPFEINYGYHFDSALLGKK